MRQFTTSAFEDGSTLVGIDHGSPDRLAARAEALHPADCDFDPQLAPDDDGMTIDAAGIKKIPRDALKVLLRFIIPATGASNRKRYRAAQLRLLALAKFVGLDDLAEESLERIARDLDCTRSLLSLYSVRMVDSLNINKSLTGKSRQAREAYRQSAIESHRRRGNKLSQDCE